MQEKGKNAKQMQKCKKKAENARSISKFMHKKDRNEKKAENAFQFRNSYKKKQKWKKRRHIYLDFYFAFISPVHFFLHFKPKNSYKKRQKCKKRLQIFFKFVKYTCKKSLKKG